MPQALGRFDRITVMVGCVAIVATLASSMAADISPSALVAQHLILSSAIAVVGAIIPGYLNVSFSKAISFRAPLALCLFVPTFALTSFLSTISSGPASPGPARIAQTAQLDRGSASNWLVGTILFDAPKQMRQFDVGDVEAAVGLPDVTIAELEKEISATRAHFDDAANRQRGTRTAPLTSSVTASLSGRGFDITPSGKVDQRLAPGQPTSWVWQVRPTDWGDTMLLTLNIEARVAGDVVEEKVVRSLSQPIIVGVASSTRWQGLLSALKDIRWIVLFVVVPVSAALGSLFLKSRKRQREKRSPTSPVTPATRVRKPRAPRPPTNT